MTPPYYADDDIEGLGLAIQLHEATWLEKMCECDIMNRLIERETKEAFNVSVCLTADIIISKRSLFNT